MGGGGGGGGGGAPPAPKVAAAGPARPISSYPQYNPMSYQGMTPGAQPPMPGMGAPIASYMQSVDGQPGFGGVPAAQLIQALMAGYAGVPSATQATGAAAPGMGAMPAPPGPTGPPLPTSGEGMNRKRRSGSGSRIYPSDQSAVTDYAPQYRYDGGTN